MSGVSIERARLSDLPDWAAMRKELWPGTSLAEHQIEAAQMMEKGSDGLSLIVRTSGGDAVGFAEANIRHDHVNGCETSPVGFLEGIYVRDKFRGQGIARRLVEAAATWTQSCGCTELASDASINNIGSQQMHHALGFEETQRVVYFRRPVG